MNNLINYYLKRHVQVKVSEGFGVRGQPKKRNKAFDLFQESMKAISEDRMTSYLLEFRLSGKIFAPLFKAFRTML